MTDLRNRLERLTLDQRSDLAGRLGGKSTGDRLIAFVVVDGGDDTESLKEHVRARLPKHFVPSVIVPIDAVPSLPNGKIDRTALPRPVAAPTRDQEGDQTGSREEEILRTIWQDVLGMEVVALDDDFFEIGGDSILSIQLVSRARSQGIELAPGALADYPTIRGLAVAAKSATVADEQAVDDGAPIPLTPIQRWFFDLDFAKPEQWNQAFRYEIDTAFTDGGIREVIAALLARHEQLRVGFVQDADGWVQRPSDATDGLIFESTSLETLQTDLAFDGRPLVRFGLDREGENFALTIVAHHLVVDHVSWQILAADLEAALGFLADGREVEFCDPVTSFGRAASELASRERSENALDPWRAKSLSVLGRLPVDREVSVVPTEASSETVRISTDAGRLESATGSYSVSARELALVALVHTMASVTGRDTLRVGLEGHGRDLAGSRLDLGQAVGWFTTFFPARLRVGGMEETLKAVKETTRLLEAAAADYGQLRYAADKSTREGVAADEVAEDILFNHLGRISGSVPAAQIRSIEALNAHCRAPENRRSHLLELNSWLEGDQLVMDWVFNAAVHDRATVEGWVAAYVSEFDRVLTHCESVASPGFTPSDFPEAELGQEDLDDFLDSL